MGAQQSLRGCQGGLMLNMDTAASAFLMELPVLQFLLRACLQIQLSDLSLKCMQVRMGAQQSLRGCQGGLMLNMDTAASAFLMEQPVLQFLLRACAVAEQALYGMDNTVYRKADKAIKNIKVWPGP